MAGPERGFALLEGLLVAVLLGVGLLGLVGLELATLRARGAARDQLEGLAVAMAALEEAGLELEPGPVAERSWTRPRAGAPQPFYRVTVIQERPGRVAVRVSWPVAAKAQRSLALDLGV